MSTEKPILPYPATACRTCKDYPNKPVEGFDFFDEHPKCSHAAWIKLVAENETRQGYWQHVREKLQEELAREPLIRKQRKNEIQQETTGVHSGSDAASPVLQLQGVRPGGGEPPEAGVPSDQSSPA